MKWTVLDLKERKKAIEDQVKRRKDRLAQRKKDEAKLEKEKMLEAARV